MFNKEIEIEFTENFTSPVLGNVYIGKKAKVRKDLADKFIKNGQAKLAGSSDAPAKADGTVKIVTSDDGKEAAAKEAAAKKAALQSQERLKAINNLKGKANLSDKQKDALAKLESAEAQYQQTLKAA